MKNVQMSTVFASNDGCSKIFGLAYACPKGDRLKNCPLHSLDCLSFGHRIDWIRKAGIEFTLMVLERHAHCTINT